MNYKKLLTAIVFSLLIVNLSFSTEKFTLDKAHTRVGFAAKHMVITTVRGEFNDYNATMLYDEDNVTNSSLEGTIQVASIDTKNERRDNHLRSEDFFYAEKYPQITFKSKEIKKNGDNDYVMVGDLSMRGVTREIAFPFVITGLIKDNAGNKRVGFETSFTLNRKDFGISWNKTMDIRGLVVSDEITVEINGEAVFKNKSSS